MGVAINETSVEITTATASVTANSRKSLPTMPPMNRSGMKTATRDKLMATTVKPTSRTPRSAAARAAARPCSMWCATFSTTTIASSTTKPVEMMSAISDRLLRLYPRG